jgi:DNA adenine methylase
MEEINDKFNKLDIHPYQIYLNKLKSKKGYKRVVSSPLRYAGGKSNAIGQILENLPDIPSKRIISLFFGGGSFELYALKELNFEIIGYDIFEMLVNFWNSLIKQKDEFIEELEKFKITKEEFTYNRHVLLNYWNKIKPADLVYNSKNKVEIKDCDKILLDNNVLLQSVYYYYNMTLSYGPMFLGWPSSSEINYNKFQRKIEKLKKMDFSKLKIKCDSFDNAILNHPNDFLFLDPPYFIGEGSKMFKGMYPNCNFAIHHNNFDHIKLRDMLINHKGGFLLTYNDCSIIREWYKDFKQIFPSWQYTYGQGEKRIGKNRENGSNIKESHEIFIISDPQTEC